LKNGKKSAGKQSRHIRARYFWISDRLKQEGIDVEFCPTGLMLADFFTKSLVGSLFQRMRDVVQGIQPISTLKVMDVENELKKLEEVFDGKSETSEIESDSEDVKGMKRKEAECISLLQTKERVGKRRFRRVSFSDEVKFARICNNTVSSLYNKKTIYPSYKNIVTGVCT